MQEPPDRAAPGDAVTTRDEEDHGVSASESERQTEVGQVRTQRGAPGDIPEDVRRHGHEPTDVRVRSIVYAILGLIAAIAGSAAFVGGVLFALRDREDQVSVPAVWRATLFPPEPRLQLAPQADRKALEEAARAQLARYGWTEERGRARIPIQRAMELLAAHGWPDPDEPDARARDRTGEEATLKPAPEPRMFRPAVPQGPSDPDTPSLKAPP